MKKIFLVAAFSAAGFMNANGTVENKFDAQKSTEQKEALVAFQLCGVMVTYFNSQGQPTGQTWFTSDQPNLNSCMAYQAGVIADLRSQGYNVKALQPNSDVNP